MNIEYYDVTWNLEQQSIGVWNSSHHFSNVYPCELLIDGRTYNSVEQAYQAMKYPHLVDTILDESHPERIPRMVEKEPDPKGWEERKVGVMYQLVNAKVRQNKNVYNMLIKSRGWLIYEDDPSKRYSYWGISKSGGDNWAGKILMQIRYELQMETLYYSIGEKIAGMLPIEKITSLEKFLEFRTEIMKQRLFELEIKIPDDALPFEMHRLLECAYLEQSITEFGLEDIAHDFPMNEIWEAIITRYHQTRDHDETLYLLATILEVNKFTATWDQIDAVLETFKES